MRLTQSCPYCHKDLVIVSSFTIAGVVYNSHKCGHTLAESNEIATRSEGIQLSLTSIDGSKHARSYQETGVDFIVNGKGNNTVGFNCIIGDQMRLGKTPQSLLAVRTALDNNLDRFPVLIIVKAANYWQWIREFRTWTSSLPLGIFPIQNNKEFIPPGFSAYIISQDLVAKKGKCACGHAGERHEDGSGLCNHGAKNRCANNDLQISGDVIDIGEKPKGKRNAKPCYCQRYEAAEPSMVEKLLALEFKLVIADESHAFKNDSSSRTVALVNFLHEVSEDSLRKTVPMSCFNCSNTWNADIEVNMNFNNLDGTVKRGSHSESCPKCNAPNSHAYVLQDLPNKRKCGVVLLSGTSVINSADEYFVPLNIVAPSRFPSRTAFRNKWLDPNSNYTRVKNYQLENFRKEIEPYVLRREWDDVYASLPPLNRSFSIIEIEDEYLRAAYNRVLDELEMEMVSKTKFSYFDSIGMLTKLRRICGMAKIKFASNYIEASMLDAKPWSKYAIGLHHIDVRNALAYTMAHLGVMTLSGEDSPQRKDQVMTEFARSPERVLAINMLAGGVGMDFYYVENVLILERQWASAYEDQFEARFFNPDKEMVSKRLYDLYPEYRNYWDGKREKVTNVEYMLAKGTIDEFFYDLVEQKRAVFGETVGNNWSIETDQSSWKDLAERTVASRL
jgi:SNF2 family DNA or RNA helicase